MIVLLVAAILAFSANGVISDNKVIAGGRCTSKSKGSNVYTASFCQIPNALFGQHFIVSFSDVRYPFTCNNDNIKVVKSNGKLYIKVTNGCDAYFQISVKVNKGTWNDWSEWSTCSKKCRTSRSRKCSTGNDVDCRGESQESQPCFNGECKSKVSNLDGCGVANPASDFRVVGGKEADKCQYPWMVMVYDKVNNIQCGGSILDEKHILTAAHCVKTNHTTPLKPASNFVVHSRSSYIIGDPSRSKWTRVKKIIAHKGYVKTKYRINDDIAMIRLSESLKFDECQRPLCLSDGSRSVQNGKNCLVMGWGYISDSNKTTARVMQWAHQRPLSRGDCYSHWPQLKTDKVFCASGEKSGACEGDSGGPFICQHEDGKYYQYGVVSSGAPNKCAELPSIYVSTNAYLDWIDDTLLALP